MTRITRSKRTKIDFSQIAQGLSVEATETNEITATAETTVSTQRAPNVQTRRSSAQASRQEEVMSLTSKLTSIWSAIKSHKDPSVTYRNRTLSKLFMSLPDKKMYPDYYEEIKNPISLDVIKRKIDNGEYLDEEAFEADMDLMCENAKKYNVEGSQIHNDAIILQKLARKLLKGETEKDKYDDEISISVDEVEHNGEIYQVGDYVHIANEVDPDKPNVAHIHKIWENGKGVRALYVCWYYRPEQTKHQATHKFYENEVFKTNTFHDHSFNDVVEKCFVLPYKDYISGRPKGSKGMSVYLCESRYNEHQKNFSKIKNWASTMPDGVPYRKVELIKFNEPIIPKKVESALVASFRKTMVKTKSEESRKEPQTQPKYEHDVDSYPEDPFSPPRAVTPIRNTRLGRPPRSRGSNRKQTPVTYQHPQSYQTAYDSEDHYNSYASSSVVHSPYSMTSGYPITSTPLTESLQNTHQYEFVASPHELPISMPPILPQHQFISQYYQAPPIQQATPNPINVMPVIPTTVMQASVMQSSAVMQVSSMQNSVMSSSATQTSVVRNPTMLHPQPMIGHRSEPMLEVPPKTTGYFACDGGGNMLWFPTPPINVIQLSQPMHSLDYLHRRKGIVAHKTDGDIREEIAVRETDGDNIREMVMRETDGNDSREEIFVFKDNKRRFQEISYHDDDTSMSEYQNQSTPYPRELDLVNGIEALGDMWRNDANLLNQQLNGNRFEY